LIQRNSKNQSVTFDTARISQNGKVILISSTPLRTDSVHEWTFEIVNCDVECQEIGVIGTSDIDCEISADGVTGTSDFKARGVYGSELATDSIWYTSFNCTGSRRCFKDLRSGFIRGWTQKDQLTVIVDMHKWRIKFYLNGMKVRKVLSLQPHQPVYPFISFAGNTKYYLH